jgi:Ni/Co efflux regulator RcnB
MQTLPPGLASQLPHPPHGTRFIYHDDQVLLIDLHSHVVLDFINISVGF